MKKRYTEEQIVQIKREGETAGSTTEVCRKYGISEWTYYRWKRRYAGMEVNELRHLSTLAAFECSAQTDGRRAGAGEEDTSGDPEEKGASVTEKRQAAFPMICRGILEHLACATLGESRLSYRYFALRMAEREAESRHRRYGYRQIRALL